jgi:hypothetical protein
MKIYCLIWDNQHEKKFTGRVCIICNILKITQEICYKTLDIFLIFGFYFVFLVHKTADSMGSFEINPNCFDSYNFNKPQ